MGTEIVIPFFNGHKTIDRLITSIPVDISVLIVDDLSDEKLTNIWTGRLISIHRLTRKQYFSGAVNFGFQNTGSNDVLVLNQDVWFDSVEWLEMLEGYKEQYAFIGERIKGNHPTFGSKGYIHGVFAFFQRKAINEVGLLDAQSYPLWGGTAEWQLRAARKGFSILPLIDIPGLHHERPNNEAYGSSIKQLLEKEPHKKELLVRTPPLLSVIVLCYNYGRYMQDCINSLIGGPTCMGEMPGQTLGSFEVIVVNDASTDDSAKIIDGLAKIEQGIRAYHLPKNVGTAQALNYGIQRAVGKYITFLSADDMREPDSLKNLVRCCEENPHSFAYDDLWLFYKHQRIKKWLMEEYDFEKLLYKNQIHAGIVFPKAAWEEVGGYPAIMHDGREDWAFNVALGLRGWCGVHVEQFGYLYRREGQNRTETNTSAYHLDYFRDKLKSLFPKIYGGHRPMACCGKGKNKATSNVAARSNGALTSENGASRMASNAVGSVGMVKLEYTGKQMASVWSGPVTNAAYVFGVDKARGWVDRRDMGERGKSGFLNLKNRDGSWLFQAVVDKSVAVVEEPVQEPVQVAVPELAIAQSTVDPNPQFMDSNSSRAVATGTLSASQVATVDFPNPTDLNVLEIKALNLTREQLVEMYKVELANRARKGLVAYFEERLAEDV